MLLIVASVLALFGAAHACVTPADVQSVSTSVTTLVSIGGQTLLSQENKDPNNIENLKLIFKALCNETNGGRAAMENVNAKVMACRQLVAVPETGLADLAVGQQNILSVMAEYDDVENFCKCPESVPCAMAVKLAESSKNISGMAISVVGEAPILCAMKDNLKCMENALEMCPDVVMHGGFKDVHMFLKVRGFTEEQCDKHSQADWSCVLDKLTDTAFDDCVVYSRGKSTDKDCGVRNCIKEYIGDSCGQNATDVFVGATNLYAPQSEKLLGETCGAKAIHSSLLFVATLFSLCKMILW